MMNLEWHAAWQAVINHPLFGVGITLAAFQLAFAAYEKTRWVFLQPVLVSMLLVVGVLLACGLTYQEYRPSVQMLTVLLGPATVALAVPLYLQFDRLKKLALPLACALLAGSVTAIVSAVGIAWLLGAADSTLLSVAPKSVTAPIAMGIAEKIGGIPSLTAVMVIMTGVSGAMMAKYVLDMLRITDHGVRGFAVGIAAHGIGTARAFQVSEQAGAFAGLGMGLNGLATAILMPLMLALWRVI